MERKGLLISAIVLLVAGIASIFLTRFVVWPRGSMSLEFTTSQSIKTASRSIDHGFEPDVEIELIAKPKKISILPGKKTAVWSYEGKLIKGNSVTLTQIPGTYLGPTIKLRNGQKIRVHFKNELPEKSIVHWHGLHVPEDMDGHPRYAIDPGETYIYEFEVKNRAGTYLYHPHPHGVTGKEVYFGLAGLFIIEDDEEQALDLPSGEFDIPMVIQDRRFKQDGSLDYISPTMVMGEMMETMWGFLGDVILVNGKPDYTVHVKTAKYRLRLANVSNARIYKLYLSDGSRFTVIGTDGGLLEAPIEKDYVVFSPGERVEVIVDFARHDIGDNVELRSIPCGNDPMRMMRRMMGRGMMGRGMMGPPGIPGRDEEFKIADFKIIEKVKDHKKIPRRLSDIKGPDFADAINKDDPRRFYFEMRMMRLTINGRTFEMNNVAPYEVVKLNTTEVWEIINVGPMPHPVHIHGLQFRIIAREGSWADCEEGYIDSGWKDTFLLMPGERAYVLLRFEDFTGMYLYHCHNLEHSDMGMMRNFMVVR